MISTDAVPPDTLLHLPLDALNPNGPYQPRRAAADDAADAGILSSIQQLGVLTPILVSQGPPGEPWRIVDGHRRVRAARAAGLATIPAVPIREDQPEIFACAVAANITRAALSPVDQWRAMVRLQDLGWSLTGAADALGLSIRLATRLDRLGRLDPQLLAAIEAHGLPDDHELAQIVAAPRDVQAAATRAKGAFQGAERVPNWHVIRHACAIQRIPMSRAIFPIAESGLPIDEDMFAEPGDKDALTTHDIDGFLALQTAALQARAAAAKGKARPEITEWDERNARTKLPRGWTAYYGNAKDRSRLGVRLFATVATSGYFLGAVLEQMAAPPPAASKAMAKTAGDTGKVDAVEDGRGEDMPAEDDEAPMPQMSSRGPVTQAAQVAIAQAKTLALRAALRDGNMPNEEDLLLLLILALGARNVHVMGAGGNVYQPSSFDDLAAQIITRDGEVGFLSPFEIRRLASEALARILVCSPTRRGESSGDAAEWIGDALMVAHDMPRFDTPEILAGISGDALRAAAIVAGDTGKGSLKAMRERLAGAAPGLVVPGGAFGAPGPERETGETADNEDAV